MRDLLDAEDKPKRRRTPAGPVADDDEPIVLGGEAPPKAPPLPGEVPPPPPKPEKAGPEEKEKLGILATVGSQAVKAAGSQVGGALAGSPGAAAGGAMAAEGLAALGPLAAAAGPAAIALGAVAVGAVAVVAGTKAMVDALTAGADSIKDLSPDVALANAENEIRQTFAMLRRAEQVGPQLGNFQRDMGDFNEQLTDIFTKVLEELARIWEENHDLVDAGKLALKILEVHIPLFGKQLDLLVDAATNFGTVEIKKIEEMQAAHKKATDETNRLLAEEFGIKAAEHFDPFAALDDLRRIAGGAPADPTRGRGRVPGPRRNDRPHRGRGGADGPGRGV
jgi:hypothetical protein